MNRSGSSKFLRYILLFTIFQGITAVSSTTYPIFAPQTAHATEYKILFHEDFDNLKNWKPFYLPNREKHTVYTIESKDTESYLKTESNQSVSALAHNKEFNVYEFPYIKWQWKVENVYEKGDVKTKKGDDNPLCIYVMFKYNPDEAEGWQRIKYAAAKLFFGRYPPHSSLHYIWANNNYKETIITSSYTKQSKMFLLQKGKLNLGKWITQEVNIVEDYKEAFGKKPPPIAGIAIMSDSDNTGESATAYVNYIQIHGHTK